MCCNNYLVITYLPGGFFDPPMYALGHKLDIIHAHVTITIAS